MDLWIRQVLLNLGNEDLDFLFSPAQNASEECRCV